MTELAQDGFSWRAVALAAVAWIVPGCGHFVLGRRVRGIGFAAVIATAFLLGLHLEGNLYRVAPGQPLSFLATLGAMGAGAPYFVARFGAGFSGSPEASTYEYGTIFLLSAGLMNLLVVLDVWDLASGRKERD